MCARNSHIYWVGTQRVLASQAAAKCGHRFYEESTEEYNFDAANACLTGMGIGLLASAAIAMSQSMSDIPLAGAEAVRTAFRLGVLVDEVSQNLEPREEGTTPDTWAIVVTGVTESGVQKELDTIQSKAVSSRSCAKHPYKL